MHKATQKQQLYLLGDLGDLSGKVLLEKIRDWRWTLKRRKALDKKGKGMSKHR